MSPIFGHILLTPIKPHLRTYHKKDRHESNGRRMTAGKREPEVGNVNSRALDLLNVAARVVLTQGHIGPANRYKAWPQSTNGGFANVGRSVRYQRAEREHCY